MKTHKGTLVALLSTLFLPFAAAQSIPPTTFKHIIIIVQENRTPDNLFGALPNKLGNCAGEDPFEPGVDIYGGGTVKGQIQPQCLTPLPLSGWDASLNNGTLIDPDHYFTGWTEDFDGGLMDGFCHVFGPPACPEYSYVQTTDVQPYFDIALNYGFANYMFQTNEGPSFPAHQFLFTGTSAPVAPKDNYYIDFVGDTNPTFTSSGCANTNQDYPEWVLPTGVAEPDPRQNPNECYPHDSLVTATNGDKGVSWAYYTQSNTSVIWDAPAAIPEVCYGENDLLYVGQACGSVNDGTEWNNHMRIANESHYSNAPIFDDLFNCNLPAISWVTPDGAWSDHPVDGATSNVTVYGPSWVGDIIDAVGGGMSGSTCNPPSTTNAFYWVQEPTAIFVTWDDWGGWYDHVAPFAALQEDPHPGYLPCDPASQWGCGYTYGFRVPLLVVSPWTPAGYVSGACGPNGCKSDAFPYQHDFGSILAYTEQVFPSLPFIDQSGLNGYADYNAPDWGPKRNNIPLSDFFQLPLNQPRLFTSISTPEPFGFFQQYYKTTGNSPSDPDDY